MSFYHTQRVKLALQFEFQSVFTPKKFLIFIVFKAWKIYIKSQGFQVSLQLSETHRSWVVRVKVNCPYLA